MHVESERVGERVGGGGRAFEIGADDQLACRFGMTVHVQFTQCGRGLANLPHTHFVERNVDLSLQPVLRVVCGASVAQEQYFVDHGSRFLGFRIRSVDCPEADGKR